MQMIRRSTSATLGRASGAVNYLALTPEAPPDGPAGSAPRPHRGAVGSPPLRRELPQAVPEPSSAGGPHAVAGSELAQPGRYRLFLAPSAPPMISSMEGSPKALPARAAPRGSTFGAVSVDGPALLVGRAP